MIDAERFDLYWRYRMVLKPYNTDPWDVMWAAFAFAQDF